MRKIMDIISLEKLGKTLAYKGREIIERVFLFGKYLENKSLT